MRAYCRVEMCGRFRNLLGKRGTKIGKPILNRRACLLGNFELNRPTCLLLNHRRSVSHSSTDTYVIGLQPDEITAPKFAIDGKVEQSEVTFSPL